MFVSEVGVTREKTYVLSLLFCSARRSLSSQFQTPLFGFSKTGLSFAVPGCGVKACCLLRCGPGLCVSGWCAARTRGATPLALTQQAPSQRSNSCTLAVVLGASGVPVLGPYGVREPALERPLLRFFKGAVTTYSNRARSLLTVRVMVPGDGFAKYRLVSARIDDEDAGAVAPRLRVVTLTDPSSPSRTSSRRVAHS